MDAIKPLFTAMAIATGGRTGHTGSDLVAENPVAWRLDGGRAAREYGLTRRGLERP